MRAIKHQLRELPAWSQQGPAHEVGVGVS